MTDLERQVVAVLAGRRWRQFPYTTNGWCARWLSTGEVYAYATQDPMPERWHLKGNLPEPADVKETLERLEAAGRVEKRMGAHAPLWRLRPREGQESAQAPPGGPESPQGGSQDPRAPQGPGRAL